MSAFVEGRDRATARRRADQESGAWKEEFLLHRMSPEMVHRRCDHSIPSARQTIEGSADQMRH
jgi:hypothetical protein